MRDGNKPMLRSALQFAPAKHSGTQQHSIYGQFTTIRVKKEVWLKVEGNVFVIQ